MRKVLKYGLVFAVVMTFGAGSALAADQTKKRARAKDGSCRSSLTESVDLAAGKIQKRDRKRNGSCQSSLTESMDLAAGKIQKRERKRDRSCQSSITEPDADLIFAADRERDRIKRRGGSC